MRDWVVFAGLLVIAAFLLAIGELSHQIQRLAAIGRAQTPAPPPREVTVIDVPAGELPPGPETRRTCG